MASKIFLNLAVKDQKKSFDFFTHLGFTFNPQFTEPRFKGFTKKEICNSHKNTEVFIAIDIDNKEKVDAMVKNAVDSGGSICM